MGGASGLSGHPEAPPLCGGRSRKEGDDTDTDGKALFLVMTDYILDPVHLRFSWSTCFLRRMSASRPLTV